MKKLICSLCLVFVFILTFAFGCDFGNNTQNNGDWIEVQSITYTILPNGKETTLNSTFHWTCNEGETIYQEEYDSLPNELKENNGPPLSGIININKDNLITNPNEFIGKSFYYFFCFSYTDIIYRKYTLNSYEVRYVKIRFLADGNIEINYYETINYEGFITIRVHPLSYAITYFNE